MTGAGRQVTVVRPKRGQTVRVAGDVYRFLGAGAGTDGSYVLLEAEVPPGGGPPPHMHAREEEGFYILEGEIDFTAEGTTLRAGPGAYPSTCPRPRRIPSGTIRPARAHADPVRARRHRALLHGGGRQAARGARRDRGALRHHDPSAKLTMDPPRRAVARRRISPGPGHRPVPDLVLPTMRPWQEIVSELSYSLTRASSFTPVEP